MTALMCRGYFLSESDKGRGLNKHSQKEIVIKMIRGLNNHTQAKIAMKVIRELWPGLCRSNPVPVSESRSAAAAQGTI